MASWFEDNSQPSWHTSITCLNQVTKNTLVLVLGKIEGHNPIFYEQTINIFLTHPGERHISSNLFESMFNEQELTS